MWTLHNLENLITHISDCVREREKNGIESPPLLRWYIQKGNNGQALTSHCQRHVYWIKWNSGGRNQTGRGEGTCCTDTWRWKENVLYFTLPLLASVSISRKREGRIVWKYLHCDNDSGGSIKSVWWLKWGSGNRNMAVVTVKEGREWSGWRVSDVEDDDDETIKQMHHILRTLPSVSLSLSPLPGDLYIMQHTKWMKSVLSLILPLSSSYYPHPSPPSNWFVFKWRGEEWRVFSP